VLWIEEKSETTKPGKSHATGVKIAYIRVAFTDQDYAEIPAHNKTFITIAESRYLAEGSPEAPPAAAGTVLAAQVSVANHAVLVLAMVLGGITGLTAVISVLDTAPRDQVAGMLLLLPPMVGALAVSLAVGGHRVLALCLLPVVLAAGTYLRRFGPAGVRLAPVLFAGYLFGFLRIPGDLRPSAVTIGGAACSTEQSPDSGLPALLPHIGQPGQSTLICITNATGIETVPTSAGGSVRGEVAAGSHSP
jgi:hypothetical protein